MRKSALACTAFLLNLALCVYYGSVFGFAVSIALAIVGIVVFLMKRPAGFLALLSGFCLAAALLSVPSELGFSKVREYVGEYSLYGEVTEIRSHKEDEYGVTFRVREIDEEKAGPYFNVHLSFSSKEKIEVGTVLSGTVDLKLINNSKYFPTASYNLGKSTVLRGTMEVESVEEAGISFNNLFYRMREGVKSIFYEYMPNSSAALTSGITLGDVLNIDPYISYILRAGGVTHILSVSGIHVSVLIFALTRLLQMFNVNKRYSIPAVLTLAVFYMLLTGLSSPMCRAVMMSAAANMSYYTKRLNDPLSILMLSASLLCVFDPLLIADISFQLSVTATLGIVLAGMWPVADLEDATDFDKKMKFPLAIATTVIMTFYANAFCLPICSVYFGELAVLSPLGNVVAAPISEAILIISLILVPASLIKPLAVGVGALCDLCCKALEYVSELIANAGLFLNTGSVVLAISTGAIVLLATVYAFTGIGRKTLILTLCVAAVFLLTLVSHFVSN